MNMYILIYRVAVYFLAASAATFCAVAATLAVAVISTNTNNTN